VQRVDGVVQHYAWGDRTFLPELLGRRPDGEPWAELWLGTHPHGATLLSDGRPLRDETGELPYLLKVLAAGQPLSLQTHPDAAQAVDGFARGVYADDRPKPELLCALTHFEALCGIRPVHLTLSLLGELGAHDLRRAVATSGAGAAVEGLLRGTLDPWPAIEACARSERPEARWVRWLDALYPCEPSVAATLLLNYVVLEPGQAVRLDAGNLHAYLRGAGVELMGASDNVVRAGLTTKPVDVDELLRVADFTALADPVLPRADRYDLPAAGVALQRLGAGAEHDATGHELAIDVVGDAWYLAPGDHFITAAETYVAVPLPA
jgi:mannose-6-phosphate isomerase